MISIKLKVGPPNQSLDIDQIKNDDSYKRRNGFGVEADKTLSIIFKSDKRHDQ